MPELPRDTRARLDEAAHWPGPNPPPLARADLRALLAYADTLAAARDGWQRNAEAAMPELPQETRARLENYARHADDYWTNTAPSDVRALLALADALAHHLAESRAIVRQRTQERDAAEASRDQWQQQAARAAADVAALRGRVRQVETALQRWVIARDADPCADWDAAQAEFDAAEEALLALTPAAGAEPC